MLSIAMSNTTAQARQQYAGFKADHVGSFLRPQRIKQARLDLAAGKISQAELTQIENEEIIQLVEQQKQNTEPESIIGATKTLIRSDFKNEEKNQAIQTNKKPALKMDNIIITQQSRPKSKKPK